MVLECAFDPVEHGPTHDAKLRRRARAAGSGGREVLWFVGTSRRSLLIFSKVPVSRPTTPPPACPPVVGSVRPLNAVTIAVMAIASVFALDGHEIDAARLAETCERYGVAELSVFGSVARGEAGPDSDVDLLFTLALSDARLGFALFDLEDELAEVFGGRFDLLSKDSVHRLIRDEVLAQAKVLPAA